MTSRVCTLALGLLAACAAPPSTGSPPAPTLAEIAAGQVRIVDLGYALNTDNSYWPGESYRPFEFQTLATLQEDGVFSGAFCMPEHLGTHLDAPNHFEAGQAAVDELTLPQLVAPLVVVDIQQACQANADYQLSREDLQRWEARFGPIPPGAVVVALSGWGSRWSNYELYKNQDPEGALHFPGFSPEAARFLVEQRQVRGIGIDTLSVDRGLSTQFEVHHIVNAAGGYHLENLAHLDRVPARGAWAVVAPIKLEGGSGGPARVWAVAAQASVPAEQQEARLRPAQE